jgi:outer membrane protein
MKRRGAVRSGRASGARACTASARPQAIGARARPESGCRQAIGAQAHPAGARGHDIRALARAAGKCEHDDGGHVQAAAARRPTNGVRAVALLLIALSIASLQLLAAGVARAQTILTLEAALEHSRTHAPELAQAQTTIDAARARIDIARSPRLPQVTGTVGYQRSTFNGSFSSGGLNSTTTGAGATGVDTTTTMTGVTTTSGGTSRSRFSLDMRNQWNATVRASQLLYDFGQSGDSLRAAQSSERAQVENAHVTALDVDHAVRDAFMTAAANKALVQVAQESLDNQARHLAQIQGFVTVGTRPAIDLAQSRTEVANAKLTLVRAVNNYAVAKTQLERAMGIDPGEYDVSSQLPEPEPEENAGLDKLVDQAEQTRPEFAALQYQERAQEYSLSANKAAYAPSLALTGTVSEAGSELDALALNYGAGVTLSWPIYQGGVVDARVREAAANLKGLRIERELLRKDTRRELEQALLSLHAAQAALEIADEVVANAKERLRLAEGRYSAGVGNVIELGDAQLVLSSAQSQRVSATYELGQARLQLRIGLGR